MKFRAFLSTIALVGSLGVGPASALCLVAPSASFNPGDDPEAVDLSVLDPADAAVAQPTAPLAPTTIDVYFHVITDGTLATESPATQISDDVLAWQLRVMNGAFAGEQSSYSAKTPFAFRHAGTTRTSNAAWYQMDGGTDAERAAKTALRRGDSTTLNVYIIRPFRSSWGTFPSSYRHEPSLDGIAISRDTLPDTGVQTGDIAVHEIGHWLGLWHTFQGGCTGGDYVDDTPPQASPTRIEEGCDETRDTCAAAGTDPVHNFMDYSLDQCKDQFTAGQNQRMQDQWKRYRALKGRGSGRTR